jgi:hypothetical protein
MNSNDKIQQSFYLMDKAFSKQTGIWTGRLYIRGGVSVVLNEAIFNFDEAQVLRDYFLVYMEIRKRLKQHGRMRIRLKKYEL